MKPIEQTLDMLLTEYKVKRRNSNYYDGQLAVIRRLQKSLKIQEKVIVLCPFIHSNYRNDIVECLGQKCGCWNHGKKQCGLIR